MSHFTKRTQFFILFFIITIVFIIGIIFFKSSPSDQELTIKKFSNQDFSTYNEQWIEMNNVRRNLIFDGTFYYFVDKKRDRIVLFGPDTRTGDKESLVIDSYTFDESDIEINLKWKSALWGSDEKNERRTSVISFETKNIKEQNITIMLDGKKGEPIYLDNTDEKDKKLEKKSSIVCRIFSCEKDEE